MPPVAAAAGHPPAGRTHHHLDAEAWPWLELHLPAVQGTIAITHDRYFLDNVARLDPELDRGEGIPSRRITPNWLEKTARLEQEEKQESKRQRVLKSRRNWVGAATPAAAAPRMEGPPAELRQAAGQSVKEKEPKELHPQRAAPGDKATSSTTSKGSVAGSHRRPEFRLPPAGYRGHHRSQRGPVRRSLFRMVIGPSSRTAAPSPSATPCRYTWTRAQGTCRPTRACNDVLSGGLDNITFGNVVMNTGPTWRASNFTDNQSKRWACSPAVKRNRLAPGHYR